MRIKILWSNDSDLLEKKINDFLCELGPNAHIHNLNVTHQQKKDTVIHLDEEGAVNPVIYHFAWILYREAMSIPDLPTLPTDAGINL